MSNPKPPSGFTALNWAVGTIGKPFDTIGVCVDYLEPAKSKGTDFTSQFVLHDPSWYQDRGMKFRFFNSSIERLPRISGNGDVVILRNVLTKDFNSRYLGMSNSATSWVVVSGSSILESTCPNGTDIRFIASSKGYERAPAPTAEELRYAKEIVSLEDSTSWRPPPKATSLQIEGIIKAAGGTPAPRKDKRQLIQDLVPDSNPTRKVFADLFGEVRKTWYNDYGRLELSLTDYTTNKLLYNYSEDSQSRDGDDYGYSKNSHDRWPGPWGRMTIGVVLFDGHAAFAKSQVQPGAFVSIRNCQVKIDPNGSRLEAVCRGDREDMSKVNVKVFKPHQVESDQRFKDLLQRRSEYEKMANSKGLRFGFGKAAQKESKKRELETIEQEPDKAEAEQPRKMSKAAKKREKQKQQKRDMQDQQTTSTADAGQQGMQTNQYVRCNNIEVPLKSINDILDADILKRKTPQGNEFSLPFQNCAYKSKVRVVDYYPHDIADFSAPYRVADYQNLSSMGTPESTELALTAAQSNPHTVRWEWRFFLIVEDARVQFSSTETTRPQMALLIADQDGEYLLREEATDLRANPQELAKLKEKLFVLWGDLQERKEEAKADGKMGSVKAQSKPFECFIKEYGVPLSDQETQGVADEAAGFQRMFRLFGTSI